ncbi:8115_t:CDS:2 [Acaulospora morrowiae]|uniref:8115_t:CDS:1 n=1 Tax=Acaulospora morrowiae TaxID=94023 RepID=A0A9N9A6Y1_9GLOM|nr:8115_t:CDS:2 [Acaulospora morrowiae]
MSEIDRLLKRWSCTFGSRSTIGVSIGASHFWCCAFGLPRSRCTTDGEIAITPEIRIWCRMWMYELPATMCLSGSLLEESSPACKIVTYDHPLLLPPVMPTNYDTRDNNSDDHMNFRSLQRTSIPICTSDGSHIVFACTKHKRMGIENLLCDVYSHATFRKVPVDQLIIYSTIQKITLSKCYYYCAPIMVQNIEERARGQQKKNIGSVHFGMGMWMASRQVPTSVMVMCEEGLMLNFGATL